MVPYEKTSASHTRYGLLNINNIIMVRYTHEENFLKVSLLQSVIVSLIGHHDRCDAVVSTCLKNLPYILNYKSIKRSEEGAGNKIRIPT
jgi:hypothetical protein